MTREAYVALKTGWTESLVLHGWREKTSSVVDCRWEHPEWPGRVIGVVLVPQPECTARWTFNKIGSVYFGQTPADLARWLNWFHSWRSEFARKEGMA